MRKFAFPGLLVAVVFSCVSGCDNGSSSSVDAGLPLTQNAIAEVTVKGKEPVRTGPTKLPNPSVHGPWPRVVVEETTYEFDRMQVGATLKHAFTIRNEGEADLKLMAGKSTCKCTKFELDSTTLKPGEETSLNIEWVGKFVDRNFQHGGPVYTDDPERSEINFAVKGTVDEPFRVMPENNWQLGPFVNSESATVQAAICSKLFDEFTITKIECDSPYVSATTEPMSAEDLVKAKSRCGYYVKVEVSTDMPPGNLSETLRISVDRGESYDMDINISANRLGPIKVVGADGGIWVASQTGLKLGQFRKSAGREAILTLTVDTDDMEAPLKILSSESSPKFVGVTLESVPSTAKNVQRYQLKVRVPPGIPKTRKSSDNPATVSLKTNHPTAPEFTFGVTFNAF